MNVLMDLSSGGMNESSAYVCACVRGKHHGSRKPAQKKEIDGELLRYESYYVVFDHRVG